MKFYVFLIALFGLVFAEEQVKSIPHEGIVLSLMQCLITNLPASKYFIKILNFKYPDVPEVISYMDCVAENLGILDFKTGQTDVDLVAALFSVDPNNAEDMDIIKNCIHKPEEKEVHIRPGYLCMFNTRLGDKLRNYLVGDLGENHNDY
ncbi:uncharacterized protein LOC129249119 [Anastrepha obliqua]|uniref:uncharacterized protein LOC129249119 n=1 Tax=Anastrepha obliqua TaxID=95512 RepID=UPI002409E6DE|nr:uncharacterized protein LOC129249119 [Anastrepha obliqua]